jgi:NAD(P)-dependent dehydrogenase (short-subunit alcohol dehydrogenase family)
MIVQEMIAYVRQFIEAHDPIATKLGTRFPFRCLAGHCYRIYRRAQRIQVRSILPGLLRPLDDHGPESINKAAREIPAGRPGSEAEIVKALFYLREADFCTGELLHVTGGEHLLAGARRYR